MKVSQAVKRLKEARARAAKAHSRQVLLDLDLNIVPLSTFTRSHLQHDQLFREAQGPWSKRQPRERQIVTI